MKRGDDGKPQCGKSSNVLGVRPGIDLPLDARGHVQPLTGGLSATPDDPARLPPHVRPSSLNGGHGKLPLFELETNALDRSLIVRPDPKQPTKHVFLEPAHGMPLSDLQVILCATRTDWRRFSP